MEEPQQDEGAGGARGPAGPGGWQPLRSHPPAVDCGFATFKLRALAPALGQLQHHEPLRADESHMMLRGAEQRLVDLKEGGVYAEEGLQTQMLEQGSATAWPGWEGTSPGHPAQCPAGTPSAGAGCSQSPAQLCSPSQPPAPPPPRCTPALRPQPALIRLTEQRHLLMLLICTAAAGRRRR